MPVRMRDVAERAGVSVRTVSNVVNGYVHVSADTRARVQQALDDLGYEVNLAARSLRSGRTGLVTLALPDLHAPYFAELAQAVVRAADRRGWTVLIELTGGVRERELKVVTEGRPHLTDGVLLSPLSLSSQPDLRRRSNVPLVLLGEHELGVDVDHVGIDNVAAARTAVGHLLDLGRRRVVALGVADAPTANQRLRGYLLAHEERALPPLGHRVPAPVWDRVAGATGIDRVLDGGGPPPDAVFAFNDTLALGAMRALLRRGLRIPEDVAVVGIDDVAEAPFTTPPLSSVSPDLDEIAHYALDLLDEQIGAGDGERPAREVVTGFGLAVRESTVGG
ncbi:MAG TPA: LacI family DNA-binding transcriptional regulator [Pseudonocardia sp.]